LESTIFVGNIPLTITRKHLKKFFQEYGKIVKVWFRSVPVEQNKMGTKANYVLKQYQEGADSMNAYVKFESKDSAEKACAANGTKVEEHTLRVSLCLDNNVDYDKTAFIGNLPLDIK
jgi:nucleolar protein 12